MYFQECLAQSRYSLNIVIFFYPSAILLVKYRPTLGLDVSFGSASFRVSVVIPSSRYLTGMKIYWFPLMCLSVCKLREQGLFLKHKNSLNI